MTSANQVVAGIDIGGTNTIIGLVTPGGEVVQISSMPTRAFSSPENLADIVSAEIKKMLHSAQTLIGIGIGAPNGNFHNGTVEYAPNLNWKGVVPLVKLFQERNNCQVRLTNDANAAALGEMLFGAAKGMKDFLFITLGTGLGSALVVNGEMVYGHDGFAGELGHIIVIPDGRICGCGRKGCLETYCSAAGIVTTYRSFFAENYFSDKPLDSHFIYQKAKEGEKEALDAFEFTGEILGLSLANSVAYTSPETIFLFGGLAQSGVFIFNPVMAHFEKNLLKIYKNKVKILPSGLNENNAAVLGAASLIWKN